MSEENLENKEIDLANIIYKILRNKRLVLFITIAGFLLGLYSSIKKETLWKGEFQIIISKDKQGEALNNVFGRLPGLGIGQSLRGSSLNTEIEILKSPSVLLPVFNYVKDFKIKNELVTDKWKYSSWLNTNLKVELNQGTTILNIEYVDSNKDIIIPVLTRISKAYQRYSGRDRLKSLDNTIRYLNDQIKLLKLKSNESIKLATTFARENDLSIRTNQDSLGNDLKIENARVVASNKLRETKLLIESLEEIEDNDTEAIIEFANVFRNITNDSLFKKLDDIEFQISSLKINYISEPSELKILKQQKILVGQNLKNKLDKFLKANVIKYNSIISSSTRGKGIIEKYRELTNEAFRNNNLLSKLEDQKQLLNLERAKTKEPWELIIQPTLPDTPLDKEIYKELILFTSIAFLTSIFLVLLLEKKKGLIYSESEIQSLIDIPIIANIANIPNKKWGEIANLIANKIKKDSNDNDLSVITIGKLDQSSLNLFIEELRNSLDNINITFSEDLSKGSLNKYQIIVTGLSKITQKELIVLKNKLILQNSNNLGFVIIEDDK